MKRIFNIEPCNQNMTGKIIDIINNLDPKNDNIIKFKKGVYYFYRNGCRLTRIHSSGGRSTDNYVAFPIFNLKNVTIDGGGSEFVFCDRIQPFMLQNSENITLKNFSTDFSFLRYAYCTVTQVSDEGLTISLDKEKFSYYVKDGNLYFVCGSDTISTKNKKISIKRIFPTKSSVYYLYSTNTEAIINKAATPIYVDALDKGDCVFLRYAPETHKLSYDVGDVICLAYDNDREAQMFYCENSKNISVEDVKIYRGGGMGFVADLCDNITLDRFRIELKEERNEYYTTTADGVFLTNCSGDFILRDSVIKDTYDDAMNVHGFYTQVEEVLSENEVILKHLHPAHDGLVPCKIGDVLHVNAPFDLSEIGEITVKSLSYDEDRTRIKITYDGKIKLTEGDFIENPGRMPNVRIEGCSFVNCPHVRMSAKKANIYNNYFALNYDDIYIWDLIEFWGESGAVEEVRIVGNKFADKSICNIAVGSSRPQDSNRLHQSIVIQNNEFMHERDKAIKISAVKSLREENNKFGVKGE